DVPEELQGKSRVWGLATQLYSLRSSPNGGMGDFTDLAKLAEAIAGEGACTVGVNPLHALFAAEPRHISPYSPSSRLFLNELYVAPEAVPEFQDCAPARALAPAAAMRQRRDAAREAELIDHVAVAALKRPIFEQLYRCFRERHLGKEAGGALTERGRAFRDFQRLGGRRLRNFAVFEALHQ